MTRRLASVDAWRGCTVALMLLVNDAGDWGHIYEPLKHAFASWIAPLAGPYVASLAYALAFVAV